VTKTAGMQAWAQVADTSTACPGLGAAQRSVGDADPTVVRVAEFLPLPSLPVWLTAHEAIRYTPRIRRVADHLAEAFRALDPQASPSGTASSP
jgi:hypothetical protein